MGVGKAAMLNVVHFTERYNTVMSMEKDYSETKAKLKENASAPIRSSSDMRLNLLYMTRF